MSRIVDKASRASESKHSEAPERSLTQRLDALERANEVRTKRARIKRDLKAGRVDFCKTLLSPPEYIQTMKLFDFMLSIPKYGRVKVNKCLTQCRISPSKTIGGLSERQRKEIVDLVKMGKVPESQGQIRMPASIYPGFLGQVESGRTRSII